MPLPDIIRIRIRIISIANPQGLRSLDYNIDLINFNYGIFTGRYVMVRVIRARYENGVLKHLERRDVFERVI
ncbi:MAG: hypothetical protein DRZ82_08430 [Thermoprotei archaeon]|nr:MAG: hypothetical protein DRZ82_08430 [Thermoprotei archaeon]